MEGGQFLGILLLRGMSVPGSNDNDNMYVVLWARHRCLKHWVQRMNAPTIADLIADPKRSELTQYVSKWLARDSLRPMTAAQRDLFLARCDDAELPRKWHDLVGGAPAAG